CSAIARNKSRNRASVVMLFVLTRSTKYCLFVPASGMRTPKTSRCGLFQSIRCITGKMPDSFRPKSRQRRNRKTCTRAENVTAAFHCVTSSDFSSDIVGQPHTRDHRFFSHRENFDSYRSRRRVTGVAIVPSQSLLPKAFSLRVTAAMCPTPARVGPHVDRYLRACFARAERPQVSELAQHMGITRVTL